MSDINQSNSSDSNNNDDHGTIMSSIIDNPKRNMDDDVEEVTRKIAPPSLGTTTISLGALPTMPSTGNNNNSMIAVESTIDTSPMKPSFGKQQQQKQEVISSNSHDRRFVWKLRSVPTLPDFYSLEQTAVFVPDAAMNPSEVTERISDVLRERSIEAHYDNDQAKVKCVTLEGVDFRIRLYRGRGPKYNHGIIVEVQRRFGHSLVFSDDTRAILDGAQGKIVSSPPPPPSLTRKNFLPQITIEDIDDDDDDEDDIFSSNSSASAVDDSSSSLTMVGKMMKVPGFDSQYLALQILSTLVDSEKLSPSAARAVATRLLQEPENEIATQIFRRIIDNNDNKSKTKTTGGGLFDDDDDDDNDDDDRTLRNMCLNILGKSLQAYHGTMTTEVLPSEFVRGCEPLRRCLLRDVMDAERHPNTALLSAKCLEYLFAVATTPDDDNDNTNFFYQNDAFEIAERVGAERHVDLFRQAQKCMIAIR